MEVWQQPTAEARRDSTKMSTLEGYLAPLFLALMFVGASIRLPSPYDLIIGITLWACCWLFAISGVRRGGAGARVAAGLTLTLLILDAVFRLVITFH